MGCALTGHVILESPLNIEYDVGTLVAKCRSD